MKQNIFKKVSNKQVRNRGLRFSVLYLSSYVILQLAFEGQDEGQRA